MSINRTTILFATLALCWQANAQSPDNVESAAAPVCDSSLWAHVYAGPEYKHPQDRLTIIKPCITVTGTLVHARAEADGDIHIQMKVDPQFEHLLNVKNLAKPPMGQGGHLVVEPVCVGKVKQADTLSEGVCEGFSQKGVFSKSLMGKRVAVTGVYVLDTHHRWL